MVHVSFAMAHNLKVVGSNPTPATKLQRVISYLQSALRGVFCVGISPGSTAEARGCAILSRRGASVLVVFTWACPTRFSGWMTVTSTTLQSRRACAQSRALVSSVLSARHSFRPRSNLGTPGDCVVSVSAPESAGLVVFPAPRDLDARFAGVFFESTGV